MQPFTHRSTHDQLMTDLKAVISSAEDLLTLVGVEQVFDGLALPL